MAPSFRLLLSHRRRVQRRRADVAHMPAESTQAALAPAPSLRLLLSNDQRRARAERRADLLRAISAGDMPRCPVLLAPPTLQNARILSCCTTVIDASALQQLRALGQCCPMCRASLVAAVPPSGLESRLKDIIALRCGFAPAIRELMRAFVAEWPSARVLIVECAADGRRPLCVGDCVVAITPAHRLDAASRKEYLRRYNCPAEYSLPMALLIDVARDTEEIDLFATNATIIPDDGAPEEVLYQVVHRCLHMHRNNAQYAKYLEMSEFAV